MTLPSELAQKLYQDCQALHQYRSLRHRKSELEARLPEAKHRKREADVALTEYECGGLGVLLDKLRGPWEDKLERYGREASLARSELDGLCQELSRLEEKLAALQPEEYEMIRAKAMELPENEREIIHHRLAKISGGDLLELLRQAKTALQEAQEWARPNNRIDVAPGYTAGQLLAEAEACARQCHDHLQELEGCGIKLEVHPYFENPTGYIHSVASPFGQLDRINSALGALSRTEKQVQELLMQLSVE